MDFQELLKRARRILDGNFSPRKLMLALLVAIVMLLYLGPYFLRLFRGSKQVSLFSDSAQHSLTSRINDFRAAVSSLDAHILYTHPKLVKHEDQLHHHSDDEDLSDMPVQNFAPYVGNGYIGAWVHNGDNTVEGRKGGSSIYLKQGRHLNLTVPYEPIVAISIDGGLLHEAIVSHYTTATVHKLQAWEVPSFQENHRKAGEGVGSSYSNTGGSVEITHRIYAHRTIPSLLMQDIEIINANPSSVYVRLDRPAELHWTKVSTDKFIVDSTRADASSSLPQQYTVVSGTVSGPPQLLHKHAQASSNVIVVTVASLNIPSLLQVKAHMSTTLHVITAVNYSDPVPQQLVPQYIAQGKETVMKVLRDHARSPVKLLSASHAQAWGALWRSGINIFTSRAQGALNGDLINATLYNVLSQVRAPLQEIDTPPALWDELTAHLSPSGSEGCYQGHHTLQADRLWSHLSTQEDVNRVVGAWLVTLDMQGCSELLKAGADGVLQAMLLSFGGLCFRNQHLEFNTQAKDLHRDLTFRRLRYGIGEQLNVSVEVQDHDLKPVLWVSLEHEVTDSTLPESVPPDHNQVLLINSKYLQTVNSGAVNRSRGQQKFYACDGGCLDPPVQIGRRKAQFPVKLTEPETAILYITSDLQHMEELKQTIHVKEVAVAPGHQQEVISLHRHGHKWGRLPTLFWLTIAILIITFHLFLFKLVVNEYCGGDNRVRYRKLSDF